MPHSKISTDIALFVFLLTIVAAIIFPVLDNMPIANEERIMLDSIASGAGAGSLADIFDDESNIFVEAYMHIALLIHGLLPMLGGTFTLRLPGALAVVALTLSLFRFGGSIDRYSSSFLASLLFLSSALVMQMTFNVSVVVIPAALFIFALMSLYHWLHHHGKRTFWLVVFSTAVATVLVGATAPISIALLAYVFLLATHKRAMRHFAIITAALLLACIAAFLMTYILVGDTATAWAIFDIRQQLDIPANPASTLRVFATYIILAIFPWSIPLILALSRIIRSPGTLYHKFLDLPLLQRYSLIIFLFSLPFFFFDTDLSLMLLVASIFFNMTLIGRYLLMQSGRYRTAWKVSGFTFATIIATLLAVFVILATLGEIHIGNRLLAITTDTDAWCWLLVASSVLGIYTLWRNAREIGNNNRFLYNIIFLYITAAVIYMGYAAGRLVI